MQAKREALSAAKWPQNDAGKGVCGPIQYPASATHDNQPARSRNLLRHPRQSRQPYVCLSHLRMHIQRDRPHPPLLPEPIQIIAAQGQESIRPSQYQYHGQYSRHMGRCEVGLSELRQAIEGQEITRQAWRKGEAICAHAAAQQRRMLNPASCWHPASRAGCPSGCCCTVCKPSSATARMGHTYNPHHCLYRGTRHWRAREGFS